MKRKSLLTPHIGAFQLHAHAEARVGQGPFPGAMLSEAKPVYSQRTVLDLIGRIYDAAGDSSRWPAFLEELGAALHSSANNIFVQDLRNQAVSVAAGVGFEPLFQHSYENYYKDRNIYLIRGNHRLRTGSVYPSQALCPDGDALRTEFYNDWIVPQKHRHGMLAVIYRKRSLASMIGAVRPRGTRPFGEDEVSLVRTLIPHLQRAVKLHRRMVDLEKQKNVAGEVLDRWSLGVILLDSQSRVLLMNRSAEEVVSQRDGLSMNADGLHAAISSETFALRRLIRDAIATRAGNGGESGGAIALSRPSLKRSLGVLVTPLFSENALAAHRGAAAALFVSDPEAKEETGEDTLRHLYGFTPAEASVAGLLTTGDDLKCAAEMLSVSMNTARTHLKRVFEKTGTKRQAELVRLMLKSPAQIRSKA